MAAAAMPALLKVGSMVGGSVIGKLLSRPSKAQQTATNAATAATEGLQQTGKDLIGRSAPLFGQGQQQVGQAGNYLQAAGDYYKNILGNRATAAISLAPEMRTALDYYGGSERKINRTMRGGSRDYALAELERTKTGNLAMMLPQARRSAAEGAMGVSGQYGQLANSLFGAGGQLAGQGTNALTSAAYGSNALFNQGTQIADQQRKTGADVGKLIFDVLGSIRGGRSGGQYPPNGPGT